MQLFRQHRGFSILMALGITAILMITVTGLAAMYARELKISRLTYDEILAQNSAEWMFEYGMIKIRNHADGFADSVVLSNDSTKTDKDAEMFKLKTPRSAGMEMDYKIVANSSDTEFSIGSQETLVIPLGIDEGKVIENWKDSKKPTKNTSDIKVTEWLNLKADDAIKWTIVASDARWQNVGLTWQWDVGVNTNWILKLQKYFCSYKFNSDIRTFDSNISCGSGSDANHITYSNATQEKEELIYFTHIQGKVNDFMKTLKNTDEFGDKIVNESDPSSTPKNLIDKEKWPYSNFYLVLFNSNKTASQEVFIRSDETSLFSLPKYTITSTAKKWEASQVFEFAEDKSRIYDFLKFGYYDPTENP